MHYTSSIARALVACQSKKGRTHCASLIKAYRTSNAFYSPPSLDLWSLAKARRGGPVALLLSRRTAPAMHFTPLHRSSFARLPEREGGGPTALLLSRRTVPAMHFTPLHRSTFGRLPKQEGEDLLRFSYQGVLHPQCILLPSIRGGESRDSGEGVGLFFRMHFPSTSVPSSHPRQT